MDEGQTTLAEEIKPEAFGQFKQRERPVFEKPVRATVREAKLFVNPQIKVTEDGDKQKRAYLQVMFDLDKPHKFPSGQETSEVVSNYGMSIYITGEGTEQTQSLYWGKKTDANMMKGMLCDQTGMSKNADIATVVNTLKGKKVMLKTEMRQNPEDKVLNPKVLISQFLPE